MMMMNNKETIKIDLPQKLYNNLEKLFPTVSVKVFKKIIFIIYLINKGSYNSNLKKNNNYYELSINNLKTYLSLNKQLAIIIKTLIENKIIYVSGQAIKGNNYKKYAMCTPFNYKKTEEIMTIFLTQKDGVYVKKFINDGYIVKYNTTVQKAVKQPEIQEIKEAVDTETGEVINIFDEINKMKMNFENEINSLKNYVFELENKVTNLQEEINIIKMKPEDFSSFDIENKENNELLDFEKMYYGDEKEQVNTNILLTKLSSFIIKDED